MKRRLLLDTCALVWLATGDSRLSDKAREAVATAVSVSVSPVSAWELGQKHRRGLLKLPMTPRELFQTAVDRYSLDIAPLDPEVMFSASALPEHHKDPADRFIIATALLGNMTVVTADHRFHAYDVDVLG